MHTQPSWQTRISEFKPIAASFGDVAAVNRCWLERPERGREATISRSRWPLDSTNSAVRSPGTEARAFSKWEENGSRLLG